MATKPKRNKATSPSRNKSAGGKVSPKKAPAKRSTRNSSKAQPVRTPTEDAPVEGKKRPLRAQREGTRRVHSRELSAAGAKRRQEREQKRRADEVAAQAKHREALKEQGKGWGGERLTRDD